MTTTATEFAIIDIGSNSIRYAEESDGALPDKSGIFTTRLGTGLNRTGRLAEDAMHASLDVIRELAARARAGGFVPRAYATSAVRDAANGREFADRIEAGSGVPVEILSGEQEAAFAFAGAVGEGGRYASMLDIGGASMQIVNGRFAKSWRAGCVRCRDIAAAALAEAGTDIMTCSPPLYPCDVRSCEQRHAIDAYMDKEVSLPEGLSLDRPVGVGGSITTLAALKAGLTVFDREAVENVTLSPADVEALIERLVAMGGSRKAHPMLIQRHDVILYGAYVLAHALRVMRAESIGVSCRDGMEGYLYELKNRAAAGRSEA